MDVFLFTHVFELLRPYGDTHFTKVGFFQEEHIGSGLAYATADAEGYIVVHDRLMVGKFEEIESVAHFQLRL